MLTLQEILAQVKSLGFDGIKIHVRSESDEDEADFRVSVSWRDSAGFSSTFEAEDPYLYRAIEKLLQHIPKKPCEIGDIVSMGFRGDSPNGFTCYALVTEMVGPRTYGCGWRIRGVLLADAIQNDGSVYQEADGIKAVQDTFFENIKVIAKSEVVQKMRPLIARALEVTA